ncbi:Detected protein of confused Function [Hibiscus syriacus]|uniref:Detected protein of confused Function n=1 Tax=Hibiscus syriacus TaxID=106335 RepID=A0A6A2XGV0_HIBSY|nr:Detected protein of confused Function [Hibiscus syriacus]
MDETRGECVYQDKWYDVDVLVNILSRLPINSILLCKSVCKHWHRLINSQAFIDVQLLWSRKNSVYLVYPFMDIMLELYFVKSSGEIAKRMNFPYCDNFSPITFICCFDGLLCCINYPWKVDASRVVEDETDLEIRICNPVTRKALLIPKGRVPYCPMHPSHSSLGSNHVFVNGTIYWFIASDEDPMIPGSILTVDIEETFGSINLPMDVTEHSYLVDLKGCLSLVAVHDDEIMNIWILEDKNEPKWELKCSGQVPFSHDECVEFVVARENEIFLITSKRYYIYDSDHKVWRQLDLSMNFEMNFPVAFTYTESLLSCGGRIDPRIEYISDERST